MDEIFLNELRKALNDLYDLNHLRSSPLCKKFHLDNPFDAPMRLQRILEDAIGELKPKNSKPQSLHARKTYELLSLRYLQQFSQKEVADQLGVSLSQMNRIQQKALEDLAAILWQRYPPTPLETSEPVSRDSQPNGAANLSADMDWIAVPSKEKTAPIEPNLRDVLKILHPLLSHYPLDIDVELNGGEAEVLVYPAALRQIFLMILTSAAKILASGRMRVSIQSDSSGALIRLDGSSQAPALTPVTEDLRTNLDIAHNLVHLSGGTLDFTFANKEIKARLRLPMRASIPVLVVDDSQEILDLMDRFTADTPYRVITCADPLQAISIAENNRVQVIFLDIMMPRVDGWELLQKIRNHPSTDKIPIVVCSIMRQEELASSLGANAYLRKPVNQEALLTLLNSLCGAS